MSEEIDVDSRRYGLIAKLADIHKSRGFKLGKTALQKEVYFLQTLFGVDCDYDFTLYTYGPFSSELLADLDLLNMYDGVIVYFDSNLSGYQILPGKDSKEYIARARPFLKESGEKIKEVVEEFGKFSAKELELRATIVFADRELGEAATEYDVVGLVHDVKPHFSREKIERTVRELRDNGYLALA